MANQWVEKMDRKRYLCWLYLCLGQKSIRKQQYLMLCCCLRFPRSNLHKNWKQIFSKNESKRWYYNERCFRSWSQQAYTRKKFCYWNKCYFRIFKTRSCMDGCGSSMWGIRSRTQIHSQTRIIRPTNCKILAYTRKTLSNACTLWNDDKPFS